MLNSIDNLTNANVTVPSHMETTISNTGHAIMIKINDQHQKAFYATLPESDGTTKNYIGSQMHVHVPSEHWVKSPNGTVV